MAEKWAVEIDGSDAVPGHVSVVATVADNSTEWPTAYKYRLDHVCASGQSKDTILASIVDELQALHQAALDTEEARVAAEAARDAVWKNPLEAALNTRSVDLGRG